MSKWRKEEKFCQYASRVLRLNAWPKCNTGGQVYTAAQITMAIADGKGSRACETKGFQTTKKKRRGRKRCRQLNLPNTCIGVTCSPKIRTEPVIRRISCKQREKEDQIEEISWGAKIRWHDHCHCHYIVVVGKYIDNLTFHGCSVIIWMTSTKRHGTTAKNRHK